MLSLFAEPQNVKGECLGGEVVHTRRGVLVKLEECVSELIGLVDLEAFQHVGCGDGGLESIGLEDKTLEGSKVPVGTSGSS